MIVRSIAWRFVVPWLLSGAMCGCGASVPAAAAPDQEPAVVVAIPAAVSSHAPSVRVRDPEPPAPRTESEWVELGRGESLKQAIQRAARQASSRGHVPVVFVGRRDCEPCEAVKHYRTDPRMQDALEGTSVVEVDLFNIATTQDLSDLGILPGAVPVFYVFDYAGHYSGLTISGGAWGDDIPENMAPPLKAFFRGIRSQLSPI